MADTLIHYPSCGALQGIPALELDGGVLEDCSGE